MENREKHENEVLQEDFLISTYPEFFEKDNMLFEEELNQKDQYFMVGYIMVDNQPTPLFDTEELIVLSDEILDLTVIENEEGYYD